jgi:hypothetical protein
VVKEKILDFSSGFVEKHKIIKQYKSGIGLHKVTIEATVKRWQIIERVENLLNTKGYTGKFDGRALWAQIQSKLGVGQKGAAFLKKALKDLNLPYSLLKAEPLDSRPKLLKRGADASQYEWKIKVQYDQERYQKVVLPKLKQVLGDIAMAKVETPVRANVKDNPLGVWGRSNAGWNRIGVHDYLFGVLAGQAEKIVFDRQLPGVPAAVGVRPPRDGGLVYPPLKPGQKKPVAGGVPVFLMEAWQRTGQQTYQVYWVNLECAIVLREYFSATSALKLDLRDKDKIVKFTKTIHFWGDRSGIPSPVSLGGNRNKDGGVEMLGLIKHLGEEKPKELKARVLLPTLIYGGSSEFLDTKYLVEKMLLEKAAGAEFVWLGRSFRLAPGNQRLPLRQINTVVIMPLMHLQQSGNRNPLPMYQLRRGVTAVVYHPWRPKIPNAILKEVRQITCEIVNFGK